MDIKETVSKAVEKIMSDKKLQEEFKKNPEKALESVLGFDIPDGLVDQVTAAVKAKMAGNQIAAGVGALKKLF